MLGANATPGAGGAALSHQAFVYGSCDAFVEETAPLVRDALARGDTAFVATQRANVDALREELGDDAERALLHDTLDWCTRPYDRLQAVRALVAAVAPGRRVLAFGEPIWSGPDAARRQWARYESIINLALADAPLRFICLYDGARLPDKILEYAVSTHPEQVEHGVSAPCGAYVPPERFLPGSVPEPPPSSEPIPVVEAAAFRAQVAREALAAGLPARRAEDLVLAANEIATNGLLHGRAPVRAHVWRDSDAIVCRVDDGGPGVSDPLAGWLPPARPAEGGWGLVLARQLADALEAAADGTRSSVALHFALGADDEPGARAA